jgi:hypothetical protein
MYKITKSSIVNSMVENTRLVVMVTGIAIVTVVSMIGLSPHEALAHVRSHLPY